MVGTVCGQYVVGIWLVRGRYVVGKGGRYAFSKGGRPVAGNEREVVGKGSGMVGSNVYFSSHLFDTLNELFNFLSSWSSKAR